MWDIIVGCIFLTTSIIIPPIIISRDKRTY